MSNKVVTKEQEAIFIVNNEEVKLSPSTVRNYLTKGNDKVTDQEIVMFINLCKYQKLNPFLNEVYLVKFKGSPAQIIVSKEAYMKRAESHPEYSGFEAGIIVEREGELVDLEGAVKLPTDTLIGGWAKVYRKDRDKPTSVRISIEEFGKGQATWKQMPLNMIRKTAIVNAQREAFPENLGALYTEDDIQEMPATSNTNSEVQQEIEEKANKKTLGFKQEQVQEAVIVEESKQVKEPVQATETMQGQVSIEGPGF